MLNLHLFSWWIIDKVSSSFHSTLFLLTVRLCLCMHVIIKGLSQTRFTTDITTVGNSRGTKLRITEVRALMSTGVLSCLV
jgi:hypothetical protein